MINETKYIVTLIINHGNFYSVLHISIKLSANRNTFQRVLLLENSGITDSRSASGRSDVLLRMRGRIPTQESVPLIGGRHELRNSERTCMTRVVSLAPSVLQCALLRFNIVRGFESVSLKFFCRREINRDIPCRVYMTGGQ